MKEYLWHIIDSNDETWTIISNEAKDGFDWWVHPGEPRFPSVGVYDCSDSNAEDVKNVEQWASNNELTWKATDRPHYYIEDDLWLPVLEVGDKVRFEMNPGDKRPRWNHLTDRGPSGEWEEGVVNSVYKNEFKVDCTGKYERFTWFFPTAASPRFPGHNKPGWALRVDTWQEYREQGVVPETPQKATEEVSDPFLMALVPRPTMDGYGPMAQDRMWKARVQEETNRVLRTTREAPLCWKCSGGGKRMLLVPVFMQDAATLRWRCECED